MEPARHAILGPSAATRWLNCTPSARFEEQVPDEESIYALEGTLAHSIAATVLSARAGNWKGTQPEYLAVMDSLESQVGQFYELYPELTGSFEEMYEYAETWAAYLCELGGDILIEQEYDLSQYVPLGFGTADATNITKKVLYVSDLKYGSGVKVGATGNSQLMLYGLGALVKAVDLGHRPETVVLTIYQPRAGGWPTWTLPVKDLLEWAEMEVRPKALKAISGQGDFKVGTWCQFCKARTVCSAYYEKYQDVYTLFSTSDPRKMTPAQVAEVLEYGPLLAGWVEKVKAQAIADLQAGKTVQGFKLVNSKGRRGFINEDDVVDALIGADLDSEDIFKMELRSITDLEKQLGKKRFSSILGDLVIMKPGKETIAPADDARQPVGASAADEYD